ncbi:efflux RND transporter periplasmic adaptor subunit [Chloroflexota bacterium]
MKNWRIASVLLLCLALVISTACSPLGGDSGEETSQQMVEVVRGDLSVSVSGSGNIVVSNDARLVFGAGGKVDKIFVDEDDEIAEGEVVAKLETAPLEMALTQAQAALVQAQITWTQTQLAQNQADTALSQAQAAQNQAQIALNTAEDNLEDAYDFLRWLTRILDKNDAKLKDAEVAYETAGLEFEIAEAQFAAAELQLEIAESQLDLVEPQLEAADLQLEIAEQALEEAQKQLDGATITAPFDGAVVSVDVDEGDTVSTVTPIVYLIDLSSIELKAEVDEIDIAEVEPGQRAIIEVDALPTLQLEGKVSSISLMPIVEAGLVMYDVTIGFDFQQDYNLRIGMSATVDIVINERSNVLVVPNRSITQDSQGNPIVQVMVDEESEKIEERPVVLGISDDFQTEIVDGLEEGELVKRQAR